MDAIGSAWRRHCHQPISAQGGKKNLEIVCAAKRPVGHHRHLALHPLVDDEGASRDARRILDEGADIGIADIQRLLSRNWRSEDKREGGRYFAEMSGHWPCKVRAIDRKSTRLNSKSLIRNTYAVCCLKKK